MVSVVIPMYNSQRTIIRALESVVNQSFKNHIEEIIVVNDGSTDDSLKLIQEFCENSLIKIIVLNQNNQGVSSARNNGMELAKGDWIALLDADDEWLPHKLEKQIEQLIANPEIDFLGCSLVGKNLKILSKKITNLYKADIKDICIKMFPQTSTAIFKKKIFDEIGGYDINQKYAEDGNYFMKICSLYNYYYSPMQLVVYDGGKPGFGSSGLSANLKEMHKGYIKNIKELREKDIISRSFYFFLYIFYCLKYIRRCIISKLR